VTRSTPRFYFSFRSPYSWLAYHDLITHHPGLVSELEWRPFWEPSEQSERLLADRGGRFIYTPMSKEKHLYILGDVKRLAQRRGLPVSWPVDVDPCWEISHLAYFTAADAGLGMRFIDRVYRARWQEGRNICDRATIAQLAEEIGIPGECASEAVNQEEMRQRGLDALLAIGRDNVFGVPFFINRSQKFWGVDRLSDFLHSLHGGGLDPKAADSRLPVGPASGSRAGDQGHAGGCG